MTQTSTSNIDLAAALAEAEEQYRAANPKSLAQHREACTAMPGGNTRASIHVDPFPLTIAHGEGARLWDLDDHKYSDFLSEFTARYMATRIQRLSGRSRKRSPAG